MWTMNNSDGTIRFLDGKYSNNRTCPICGQYIRTNEKFCFVIIPSEYRKEKKLRTNLAVHLDEWERFIEGINTDKELAEKLVAHTIPKKKAFTKEEVNKIKYFEDACYRKY